MSVSQSHDDGALKIQQGHAACLADVGDDDAINTVLRVSPLCTHFGELGSICGSFSVFCCKVQPEMCPFLSRLVA